MKVVFKKDKNGLVFAYYPKKDFLSELSKLSFCASTLDFIRGATVTQEYINDCDDATELEYKDLQTKIIADNISDKW